MFCSKHIQGTTAHAETVTRLTEALAEIGKALGRVSIELKLYQTATMSEAVSRVYAHVLLFLRKAVHWFNSNRVLRVVKDAVCPFHLKFQDTVDGINKCIAVVDRNAGTSSRAELRLLTLAFNEMQQSQFRTEAFLKQLIQEHTSECS